MPKIRIWLLMILGLLLAACAAQVEQAADITPTPFPTRPATPTLPPAPTESFTLTELGLAAGTTEDGRLFILGDPNAPVTLIDYSDFL